MTSATQPRVDDKSTNVRVDIANRPSSPGPRRPRGIISERATRAYFGLLSRLAPAYAVKQAYDLYRRTPRVRRHPPPRAEGLSAQRIAIAWQGEPLAAWQWGHGPLVVLAHGWGGHAGQMAGFVGPLVAAGHRVIAFDQPAHGASPGRMSNLLEFRQAVLAVARQEGPVAGVIAHSLGATATVLALDRGLAAARIVLVAPPLDPGRFVHAFGARIGLSRASADGVAARVESLLRADLGDETAADVAARRGEAALFIFDEGDRAVPPAHSRELARAWPGALVEPVRGFGHNKILQDDGIIARACTFAGCEKTHGVAKIF